MNEWDNLVDKPQAFQKGKIFRHLWSRKFQTFAIPSVQNYKLNERVKELMKQLGTEVIPASENSVGAYKETTVAAEKLKELQFDPIEQLVLQVEEIDRLTEMELSLEKPRLTFLTALITTKQKILEALTPYKYYKVVAPRENFLEVPPPVTIILKDED